MLLGSFVYDRVMVQCGTISVLVVYCCLLYSAWLVVCKCISCTHMNTLWDIYMQPSGWNISNLKVRCKWCDCPTPSIARSFTMGCQVREHVLHDNSPPVDDIPYIITFIANKTSKRQKNDVDVLINLYIALLWPYLRVTTQRERLRLNDAFSFQHIRIHTYLYWIFL